MLYPTRRHGEFKGKTHQKKQSGKHRTLDERDVQENSTDIKKRNSV